MELRVRSTNFERRVCKNEECGALFVPIVGNQKFCSNECRDAHYVRFPQRHYERRVTKLKVCANVDCKREFLTNNRKKAYCSPECQVAHREASYVKKPAHSVTCPCGVVFETTHAGKKYHSEECRRLRHGLSKVAE